MKSYLCLLLILTINFYFALGLRAYEDKLQNSVVALKLNNILDKKNNKNTVKPNDKIKVQLVGTFDDGTVFDKSDEKHPMEFVVGESTVHKKFDEAVIGMKLNQEKVVKIKANEAFGKREENLRRELPRSILPDNAPVDIGGIIAFKDENGNVVSAPVTDITKDKLIVDLNHPLAGKDLNYKIKIIDIQ